MENYMEVPNIITGKDLDYLSDMFEWNYGAMKNSKEMSSKAMEKDIKNMLERGCQLFDNNMKMVLDSLRNGGNNE